MRKNLIIIGICFAALLLTYFITSREEASEPIESLEAQETSEEKIIETYRKQFQLKERETTEVLPINAPAALIINAENGEIIFQKNSHQQLPPASITKILTGAVALENLDLKDKIVVSEQAAAVEPNKIVMRKGEKMKVEDLMYGLMMISANDAAEVLAEGIDGNRQTFMDKMREKIRLLELKNTSFKNPSGLDEQGHYSSAYDIGKITYYAIKSNPGILKYLGCREPYSVFPTQDNESHWWGGHISATLDAYPEMLGAKTGYTEEARNTFVGIAEKNNQKFIFVFLGSDQATDDARQLLEYGLNYLP